MIRVLQPSKGPPNKSSSTGRERNDSFSDTSLLSVGEVSGIPNPLVGVERCQLHLLGPASRFLHITNSCSSSTLTTDVISFRNFRSTIRDPTLDNGSPNCRGLNSAAPDFECPRLSGSSESGGGDCAAKLGSNHLNPSGGCLGRTTRPTREPAVYSSGCVSDRLHLAATFMHTKGNLSSSLSAGGYNS
jgi:hypothetical protein